MNTEQKLEIYRELFGSLPEAPEGKKLVGVECRATKFGEIFLDLDRNPIAWKNAEESPYLYPVAIFQDTHRADGTPLSIDPLPEAPAGYRVEYIHISDLASGEENCDKMWRFSPADKAWKESQLVNPHRLVNPHKSGTHYARLYKIAQPTTLAQLVGEDGQKNVWIIFDDNHQKAQALVCAGKYDSFYFFFAGESKSIETLKKCGARWSNDPFTTWENANEFIPA